MLQTRIRRTAVLIAAVSGLGLVAACQRSEPQPQTLPPDVWASVDGQPITRADVERVYRSAVQPSSASSDEQALAVELGIVDELITQEVLGARARALNLQVTDAEVDNALAERRRSLSDEVFQQQLSQRGLSVDDIKWGIRRELLAQKAIDQEVSGKVSVTDEMVTAYFNAHRDQFNFPERQYHLAQIVITPVRDPQLRNRMNDDAGSAAEVQQKATMLADRLRAGEDFAELAADYSEDPQTAPQGGDLGFIPESSLRQLSPELRSAVLAMEPRNINTLTLGGATTLLMLVDRQEAGQRDLSDPAVRDGIREMLKSRREQVLHTAYISAALADAQIVNNLARQIVSAQGVLPSAVVTLPATGAEAK